MVQNFSTSKKSKRKLPPNTHYTGFTRVKTIRNICFAKLLPETFRWDDETFLYMDYMRTHRQLITLHQHLKRNKEISASLQLVFHNINSLKHKYWLEMVHPAIRCCDILILCETKTLRPPSSFHKPKKYSEQMKGTQSHLQRCGFENTNDKEELKTGSNGMAVFTNPTLSQYVRARYFPAKRTRCQPEFIIVNVAPHQSNLNIAVNILALHRTQHCSVESLITFLQGKLQSVEKIQVVVGDFNVNILNKNSTDTQKLEEFWSNHNFKQYISEGTRYDKSKSSDQQDFPCYDHIYVSEDLEQSFGCTSSHVSVCDFSDHYPVTLRLGGEAIATWKPKQNKEEIKSFVDYLLENQANQKVSISKQQTFSKNTPKKKSLPYIPPKGTLNLSVLTKKKLLPIPPKGTLNLLKKKSVVIPPKGTLKLSVPKEPKMKKKKETKKKKKKKTIFEQAEADAIKMILSGIPKQYLRGFEWVDNSCAVDCLVESLFWALALDFPHILRQTSLKKSILGMSLAARAKGHIQRSNIENLHHFCAVEKYNTIEVSPFRHGFKKWIELTEESKELCQLVNLKCQNIETGETWSKYISPIKVFVTEDNDCIQQMFLQKLLHVMSFQEVETPTSFCLPDLLIVETGPRMSLSWVPEEFDVNFTSYFQHNVCTYTLRALIFWVNKNHFVARINHPSGFLDYDDMRPQAGKLMYAKNADSIFDLKENQLGCALICCKTQQA